MTERRWLSIVIVASVIVRLAAIVALGAWRAPAPLQHRQIAINLLAGDGFSFRDFNTFGPTSVQTPPYPLLLATLFKVFGTDRSAAYIAAMVINAIAAGAACALLYFITRSLSGSPRVALVTAILLAIWPTQIVATTAAQGIVLTGSLLLASVWLMTRGRALLGGLAAAMACLLAPPLTLAIIVASLAALLARRCGPPADAKSPIKPSTVSQPLAQVAVWSAALAMLVGPWVYRNHLVHGGYRITTTFWQDLWLANHDGATGTDRPRLTDLTRDAFASTDQNPLLADLPPDIRAGLHGKSEAAREAAFAPLVRRWIVENPAAYSRLCAVRLGKTLWIDWDDVRSYRAANLVARSLLAALTLIGIAIALLRRWRILPSLLLWIGCVLSLSVTNTGVRQALPLEPLQFIFVAAAVASLLRVREPDPAT